MKIEDIQNIAVIGAGDMGHGIAEVFLLAGYAVSLYDIDDAAVEKGVAKIFASLEKLAEKQKIPRDSVARIRSELLTTSTDLETAAAKADFVIEVVPEVLELKKEIFGKLDQIAPPAAMLASNTSTMSITEIAACTTRPSQVLGLHFFNPAVLMRLVEVIRGDETSDETVELAMAMASKLAKIPVLVRKDTPGFIANRVNQASAVLFQQTLQRGEVEPESLDALFRSLGAPMGPCELSDYVGIDVVVHVGKYFAQTLDPAYGPPPHLLEMHQQGKLGKKTGQGYFDWSGGRPEIDLSRATRKFSPLWSIFVQINEATKLVEQGVCSVADVDLALIYSSGNPVGPMSVGRQISKWDLSEQLEYLAERFDNAIFKPTQKVRDGGHKH